MTCNLVAGQGPNDGSTSFLRNVGSSVPYDKIVILIIAPQKDVLNLALQIWYDIFLTKWYKTAN